MSDFAPRGHISSVVDHSGTIIRYAFYTAGAVAFVLIALVLIKINSLVPSKQVKPVEINPSPSFRIVDADIARLPAQAKVISDGVTGRTEIRHYGQPYDRRANFSIALVMRLKPPPEVAARQSFANVRNTLTMSAFGHSMSGSGKRYDLETRFGPVRAAETAINADGLLKPCLTFLSRFETDEVRLEGAYCEANGAKPSPHALACIIDSLKLDTKLPSAEADAFLRERIARGPNCTSVPVSQTIDMQSRRPVSPPSRWSMPSAKRY
jgi:hypothetical protein